MMCYPRVHHAAGVHVLQFGENRERGLHANSKCSSAGMKVIYRSNLCSYNLRTIQTFGVPKV